MAGDNIVVFMTFGDLTEAYLVKGILDDNAIPSFISDENVLSVYPLYNQGLGGIKLSVFERDLESAIRLVKEQRACMPCLWLTKCCLWSFCPA